MDTVTNHPAVRPPKQARSRQTLAALLDALAQLLRDRPFESITVLDLAQTAEMSTGAFYSRFKSKEDLLPALYSRFQEELAEQTDRDLAPESFAPLGAEARLARVAEILCRTYEQRSWLLRAMTIHSRRRYAPDGPTLSRDEAEASAQMTWLRRLADCLQVAPNPWPRATRPQVELALYTATTLAREAVLFPHLPMATALGIDGERMRRLLPAILHRQLGPPDETR